MTDKQRAKHNTDNAARILTPTSGSSLDTAEPTPDGLGTWLGGRAELKGAGNWVDLKSHATRTADAKNAHGSNSHIPAPPITEANQKVAPLLIEESDNIPCGEDIEPTA